MNIKIIVNAKRVSACLCENSKYLKSIDDNSVITCDENLSVMDVATTRMTNAIATNVTNGSSINCHRKKVRVYYNLHTVLIAIILLLIITIIRHHYSKQKSIDASTISNGK